MQPGCYTALVTPFTQDGARIDREALEKLVAFQIEGGITGVLAVGTTGESPTLAWNEHDEVVEIAARVAKGHCLCIAGSGSNNTREAMRATEHAAREGVDGVLLVDPYYNGPSSLEIRREYIMPIARNFPGLDIVPYVIPGRTGTQLLPEDLALLYQACPNVGTVKEATGDLNNMRRTRACCGPNYTILSGDDSLTSEMMTDPAIRAAGVICVIGNVAPHAMTELVTALLNGDTENASRLNRALAPLFDLVTVKTRETTSHGEVVCRARNPLGIKTLMALLGMPVGPCRPPLGRMTRNGLQSVVAAASRVWRDNPEILQPVADTFGVDVRQRLEEPRFREGLFYTDY
jgi:4-hydroxy-tetrahydrodipicolinate synthase